MLGVLKPIIPRLSALTLNWPMSSPQMTRMLGIWPAASCFCSTAALGAGQQCRSGGEGQGTASRAGLVAAGGPPTCRQWTVPHGGGPRLIGHTQGGNGDLSPRQPQPEGPRRLSGRPTPARESVSTWVSPQCPPQNHLAGRGGPGGIGQRHKARFGFCPENAVPWFAGGLSGTGCPEADQTLAADRLPGLRQCTKRSPSDRPSHLAGPSSGGTNAPTTPCATGRLATAFSEARYKPGRNPGSPSRNYNSSRGTSPPGTRCCGRPDRASTRVSSTRNPSVWYTMAQKSSTLTGRDVGYSAFALVLPITWPWR